MNSSIQTGFLVTEAISVELKSGAIYKLLPGDLLSKSLDGYYSKLCPGVLLTGFKLTPEDELKLAPATFEARGLKFRIHKERA